MEKEDDEGGPKEEHVLVELDEDCAASLAEPGATYALKELETDTPTLIITTPNTRIELAGSWAVAGAAGGLVLVDPSGEQKSAFNLAKRALKFRTRN